MSHISTHGFSGLRNSAGLLQLLKNGSSAAALAAAISLAAATGAHAQASDGVETVTVTGFAASLDKALDDKRQATGSQDSILDAVMGRPSGEWPDWVAVPQNDGVGKTETERSAPNIM